MTVFGSNRKKCIFLLMSWQTKFDYYSQLMVNKNMDSVFVFFKKNNSKHLNGKINFF